MTRLTDATRTAHSSFERFVQDLDAESQFGLQEIQMNTSHTILKETNEQEPNDQVALPPSIVQRLCHYCSSWAVGTRLLLDGFPAILVGIISMETEHVVAIG